MTKNRNVDALDAVYHEAALLEAKHGMSSPRQKRIAQRVKAQVEARLAEMRRTLLPQAAPPIKLAPIRPSLLALGRASLIARLDAIKRSGGAAVQYAHCDLHGLSDDDLRRMIELLEPE
jgi:hypothetical protein